MNSLVECGGVPCLVWIPAASAVPQTKLNRFRRSWTLVLSRQPLGAAQPWRAARFAPTPVLRRRVRSSEPRVPRTKAGTRGEHDPHPVMLD